MQENFAFLPLLLVEQAAFFGGCGGREAAASFAACSINRTASKMKPWMPPSHKTASTAQNTLVPS